MAAITSEDWARIWAHAWLDQEFRNTLRRNPAEAVNKFKKNFPDPPLQDHDRLFDLDKIYLEDFLQKPETHLEEMAKDGKLHGIPQQVQPNEFRIDLTEKPQ